MTTNNNNNPALKRLLTEYKNLNRQPETEFVAAPCHDDLFTWHFIIKGQKGTSFEGGIYHGKIVFPAQYPFAPPDIYFFTPNGRFETNTKICFSITSFHPDTWNPAWDVRTSLLSIIAFMPTKSYGAIGGIDETDEVRRELAIKSHEWKCEECSLEIVPDEVPNIPNDNSNNDDSNNANHSDQNSDNNSDGAKQDEEINLNTNLNDNSFALEEENYNDNCHISKQLEKIIDNEDCLYTKDSNNDTINFDDNNIINNDIFKDSIESDDTFNEDLMNINTEELYNISDNILHFQENKNVFTNTDVEQQNQTEETPKYVTTNIQYENLVKSAHDNKPFLLYPYLDIPIVIIFCILWFYIYRFHSI